MKDVIKAVTVLAIGGTIYSVSQSDIAKNFSADTGMSQEAAEQYIENIDESDLASFDEIGSNFISDGEDILELSYELDCVNYEYEWESPTMTCLQAKSQLERIGNSEIVLGKSYRQLDTENANENDIRATINNIDKLNADLNLEIVSVVLDPTLITDTKNTNSYNKALLQAALDSK